MALALADRPELAVHVVHDERSAAFVALGLGLGGMPAVLLSTSGTAAVNFHPAVVEAGPRTSRCSSSRPTVRPSCATSAPRRRSTSRTCSGVPCDGSTTRAWPTRRLAHTWRSLARRAFDLAATGPVHLNLPFRDPLVGRPGPLPPGRPPQPTIALRPNGSAAVPLDARSRGDPRRRASAGSAPQRSPSSPRRTRWPVLADPTSPARQLDGAITAFDALLRHQPFVDAHRPELIVRIGRPAASKVLAQWVADCAATGTVLVQVGGPGVIDPDHQVAAHVGPGALDGGHVRGAPDAAWQDGWTSANAASGGRHRRRARRLDRTHRAERRPNGRPAPAARRAARRRLLDAGARPRVVRRPAGQGTRQPRRQRHRRRGVDGTRRRARRPADGRPRRRHRVRPRRRRADRPAAHDAPTCASSSSTTTAAGSSRSCRRPTSSTGGASSSSSGRRTAPTSIALARAHHLDAATVDPAGGAGGPPRARRARP